MNIKNIYYEYNVYQKAYTLVNTHTSLDFKYKLTNVTTGIIVVNDTIVPPNGKTVLLPITTEGVYKLEIITYTSSYDATYNIHFYPDIKSTILASVRDLLCDCSSLDGTCSTGQNPVIQDNRDLQFTTIGVNSYKDILLDLNYVRNYLCCFSDLIGSDWRILQSLNMSSDNLDNLGKLPDNITTLRIYNLYLYLLLYVIEMDYATYEYDSNILPPGDEPDPMMAVVPMTTINPNDEDYVNTLFNLTEVKSCIVDLNINIDTVISTLTTCYKTYTFGACLPTGDTPDPDPDPPTEAVIANLNFAGEKIVLVGGDINISSFLWDIVSGSPTNLKINDDVGQIINMEVSGTSHSFPLEIYNFIEKKTVTWRIAGSNTNEITVMANWVNPIYTGYKNDAAYPLSSEIAQGDVVKQQLSMEFNWSPDSDGSSYPWVAIPANDTIAFTKYQDLSEETNKGNIGVDDEYVFIVKQSATVTVNNIPYYIYKFGGKTEFSNILKLY